MRALVTGASGFIGSTLIEELGTLGFEVDALLRPSSDVSNLSGLAYRRVEGDLRDDASLRRAVRDVDYVFHLGGLTAARSRAEYFEHNAAGTERLARAAAEERPGLSRFVFVSSLAASGPAPSREEPLTESCETRPVSAYGESKLAAERALLNFKGRIPISIVRPPMVYGPRDRGVFVLIQTVARNVTPVPRGEKYYSLIHVRDLVRGIVQSALAKPSEVASGEVFFLTGNENATFREILDVIADALGRDPLRLTVPPLALRGAAMVLSLLGAVTGRTFPLNLDKLREILPDYWLCTSEKAKARLGFAPEFDLAGGMAHSVAWYKRHRWL